MNLAGIYIHIPFCRSRCSYCDFATGIYNSDLAERYVRSLVKEIGAWFEVDTAPEVDTIYFGGGTPSLLAATQIERILAAIHERFTVTPDPEVTMEMNPGSAGAPAKGGPTIASRSAMTLLEFHSRGINRASFGVQTFADRELARLGRSHTAEDARQTFHSLRDAGFTNISFDLIAGLPGQTLQGWNRNLTEALALKPEHLSFYLLEVHEGTPLAEHIRRGLQPKPDDDLAAEMYELMGFESRHNTKYWTGAPYYGFGCSAHSYDGRRGRWSNERDVRRYTGLIERDESPIVERLTLSEEEARAERLYLGLRMMQGLRADKYQELFGADIRAKYANELARFREAGLIEFDSDFMRLTRSGALLSNEVFSAFV